MIPSKKLILTLVATAALAACGGGGSDTPAAANGRMIDGYVSGATVFCDADRNGAMDAGEESVTTSSTGAYALVGGCDGIVIGSGGVDVGTSFPFTGELKTPKGSTVITPLTTLVAGTGLSKERLAELLGLPLGTDITTIDIGNGQHQALLKMTLAIQQMLDQIAKVIIAEGSTSDSRSLYARIAASFAASMADAAPGAVLVSTTGDINLTLVSAAIKALPDVVEMGLNVANLDAVINTLVAEAQTLAKASDAELSALTTALQNPEKPTIDTGATTNFLALTDDSIALNGSPASLSELAQGTTITGLTSVGFDLTVTGAPAAETIASVALELVEVGGQNRKLQLMIDQVALTLNTANQLSVAVPAEAKVHAFGHAANGTDINLTLTDLTFTPIAVSGNGFTLNYANMVSKVLASVDNTSTTTAAQFVGIKGTFAFKVVLSKVNLRRADSTAFTNQTVTLTNTTQSVTGAGFTGSLTIN